MAFGSNLRDVQTVGSTYSSDLGSMLASFDTLIPSIPLNITPMVDSLARLQSDVISGRQ